MASITYDVPNLYESIDILPDLSYLILIAKTCQYLPHNSNWIKEMIFVMVRMQARNGYPIEADWPVYISASATPHKSPFCFNKRPVSPLTLKMLLTRFHFDLAACTVRFRHLFLWSILGKKPPTNLEAQKHRKHVQHRGSMTWEHEDDRRRAKS